MRSDDPSEDVVRSTEKSSSIGRSGARRAALVIGLLILVGVAGAIWILRPQPEPEVASVDVGLSTTTTTTTTTHPSTTTTSISLIGAIHVGLGTDLQSLVDSNPPGTTFQLESGVHRNLEISPREGNVFVGAPGAVMDGGGETAYAFRSDVDSVTVSGLIIENYDNPPQRGAIDTEGSGWRIIGNEIRTNAGAAINIRGDGYLVDGNHVHDNGQIGILGRGANGRVVNNEIVHNNPNDRFEMDWEAGGTKFLHTTNLYIADNLVHDNHGPGLWTDVDNYMTVIENNTVRDNYGPGIVHEISYDAVIRDNTVTNNAHRFYVGGILVANSSNVEVYENTVIGNDGGIVGIQDDRGSGPRGEYATVGLTVHDNTIEYTTGWTGVRVNSGTDVTRSGTITFQDNTYDTDNINRPFFWAETEQTIEQWANLGHDVDIIG